MQKHHILVPLACIILAACTSRREEPSATSSEPTATTESGTPEGSAAGVPETDFEADPMCGDVHDRLWAAAPKPGPDVNIVEVGDEIQRADVHRAPYLIGHTAELGAAARDLIPILRQRLEGEPDMATVNAIFRTLPAVSVEDTLEIATEVLVDSERTVPQRFAAADSLGRLGAPGLEKLGELYTQAGDDTERQIILRGIGSSFAYPIATRDVLFSETGLCTQQPLASECQRALRDLALVWPDMIPEDTPMHRLLRAERESMLAGRYTREWLAGFESAAFSDPNGAAASLMRVQILGPAAGMEVAAVTAIRNASLAIDQRRGLAAWLTSRWPSLPTIVPQLEAVVDSDFDAAVSAYLGLALVIAGHTDVPDAAVSAMVDLAREVRTPLGQAVDLAIARLRGPGAVPDTSARNRPDGFSRVARAVAGSDMDALARVLLDGDIPLPLALDGATIGSAGRAEEFAQALANDAFEPSARMLEVASRGALPTPDLVVRCSPFLLESSLSRDAGEWLLGQALHDEMMNVAREALGSPSGMRRMHAIQWANLAGGELDSEALFDSISAPLATGEVEMRDTRSLALFRLLAGGAIPLAEAMDFADEVGTDAPGSSEAAILLAASYDAHCTAP